MTYQIMFYGGLAAALLTLTITIYVYVKMNIRRVLIDLTGIKRKSPFGTKKSSPQSTEEKTRTTNEIRLKKQDMEGDEVTELMEDEVAATALLDLSDVEETTLLSPSAEQEDETTILGESMDETTLLSDEPAFYFRKELDVVVTHSTTKL
ncbi:SHS2 domain-containing protein [Bacillus tianshenii]|uniref:SHS2 domain-containing protein n=1 Tax=Sutcliffiella tianshenii TaxID=1463404 RepID=A0ABS2NUW3_9BACI|nr:hypothetical protein [Bacillus tianshenii]MBM7618439.1 SHS2 domain-containing protein [Bacillus tianshenii]